MIKRQLFRVRLMLAIAAAMAGAALPLSAQEAEETVRVRTRVVFLDALVRDKRSGGIAPDLKESEFEVLADGKPRSLSYFSREGDAGRRPLALVLVLDLNRIGAGRFLRRTDILEALEVVLEKLPPQDEVALLALDVEGTGRREWLTRFTRDRAQVASALSIVPLLVAEGPDPDAAEALDHTEPAAPATLQPEIVDEKAGLPQITTTNEDGSTSIKYVNRDGVLVTRTVSKDGIESTDSDSGFEFSAAVHEAAIFAVTERPQSRAAIVWLSDGLVPVPYKDRDEVTASLVQSNVIFSVLVADMKTGFKLFKPILKPLGNWAGLSIYGTSQHVARQTGGESLGVRRPEDYAGGLGRIIGNLTGCYSLGFTLAETERDDGQMHQLEVRVKARDAKGKPRQLDVVARRGFYMPKENERAGNRRTPAAETERQSNK